MEYLAISGPSYKSLVFGSGSNMAILSVNLIFPNIHHCDGRKGFRWGNHHGF